MTEVEYQAVLEDVWFDRLSASVTLAPVFQHVPEDTPPPVVILGDVSFENQGSKESPLLLFTIVILSLIKAHERKPLNKLQAQVDVAVTGWKPDPKDGVAFGDIMIGSGSGRLISTDDGSPVYYGEQIFTQFVWAF